tara:strand:- start:1380 stop:2315 length:936 start_codon:yes stop_codon:yes gene_type:complete
MIVTARVRQPSVAAKKHELGVALLQVLLICTLISLLAIRFTQTARDQIAIAEQFDLRVRAEMEAYSAINEVIFVLLSDVIRKSSLNATRGIRSFPEKDRINRFGSPMVWRSGVTIKVQDLNGLLPQMFPSHPLWRQLLVSRNISNEQADVYLGSFKDAQDADRRSWIMGDYEPNFLPLGQPYPNGYIQNSKLVKWVFYDNEELASDLLEISDVAAPYELNILNSPEPLLRALLGDSMADEVISARSGRNYNYRLAANKLPFELLSEEGMTPASNRLNIEVIVKAGGANWREKRTVIFSKGSSPPFEFIFID